MGARTAATQETRSRILAASLRLLGSEQGVTAFTLDSVAREAGVARMTVYYQFASRQGLLEAVYDELGARGLVGRLPALFNATSRDETLRLFVSVFFQFWDTDRLVMRRVRALARLDPEFERGVRDRDERRRQICRAALNRESLGSELPSNDGTTLDLILALTSFETYDALATDDRPFEVVTLMIQEVVLRVAGHS
jgi:AcrR family transcriptional regulator